MVRKLAIIALLLAGLYTSWKALYQLGSTAIFALEAQKVSAVVVDVTERPFADITEQLCHGNMPWGGETAYHPHLRYELFGRVITDTTLPDLDNRDFSNGQRVELLLHPQKPHLRHINEIKFLWGGGLTLLVSSVILLWLTRCLLRRGKKLTNRLAAASSEPSPSVPPDKSDAPPATRKRSRKNSASRGGTRSNEKRRTSQNKHRVKSDS